MFDPTAFENIKVVVEGAIYDRDLDGEILVIDRNDIVNLSKMSRKYTVSFHLRQSGSQGIFAVISINSELENLAAELLENQPQHLAGCAVDISFHFRNKNDEKTFAGIHHILTSIWGSERTVTQRIEADPFVEEETVANTAFVSFNRLVLEDHIEDLSDMVEYMVTSLKKLGELILNHS
ncbi:hypothetical protein [Mesobacillus zeae]|uniref:Group-specific protein n=1 Tax=Mesobacillus zeae TaxID=1917180 RepID=A0A398B2Y9_9BACI|nr:hypothetical protein [Mesobacillus zeae]RID84162.1 hypothetical protein D1970_13670 [Mesobacillus zeae]